MSPLHFQPIGSRVSRRRRGGSAIVIILILLSLMATLMVTNTVVLRRLKVELQLLETKQNKRLSEHSER